MSLWCDSRFFLGFGDLPEAALGILPDRPLFLFSLQAATRQKTVDGPGDIGGGSPGGKDLPLRRDDSRNRLQRRLRGQDEALAKKDEGDHVQEEERRQDCLRQERNTGTRVRNVRQQGPFFGERPAHHLCLSLEPGCGIAVSREPPGCPEQGVTFGIDDPAKDPSMSEFPEVSVDVREGNRPEDVEPVLLRSAGNEESERENATSVRKIPRRPHENRKRLPRPGSDALEVPVGGQIAGDGQRAAVPLERRALPHLPPVLHRGGEMEDLSPKIGVDLRGDERAFGRDQVPGKVRPQGADEADSADQVCEEDGEQEKISRPGTLSFRLSHGEQFTGNGA